MMPRRRAGSPRLPAPLFPPFLFFVNVCLVVSMSSIFHRASSAALAPRILQHQRNPRLPPGGCIHPPVAMGLPHGHGQDGASFIANFSFRIIPEPNSSCSTCMTPHVYGYGQNLSFKDASSSSSLLFLGPQSRRCFHKIPASYTGLEYLNLSFKSFNSANYSGVFGGVPYEPKTRKLLPGTTHGQSVTGRATKKLQHAASRGHGKVAPPASSWLGLAAIAASALVGLICAITGFVLCCIRSKRTRQSISAIITEPELWRELAPRQFRYGELAAATCNFADEKKIGRGGFGQVYRGYLSDQDCHVAVKTLSVAVPEERSVQGLKEFQAEVTVLSQLRHRNIVQLVGWWCGRRRRRRGRRLALVYELMPGGSLDTHLYNPDKHLTWPERYEIALGLGSALRYLHTECDRCVVHGDIKPANVMLDASGNAKLGDFGLARLVDHGAEPRTTQVVAGTVGYIDPELVNGQRPSTASDVYSFGVVLLEIACGRRPTSGVLLATARDMYRQSRVLDAADQRLGGVFDRLQMERLLVTGLWCAHQDPVQRPSVTEAMDVLRSQRADLPVLGAMGGAREIVSLEGRAYGDASSENSNSGYVHGSTQTEYLAVEYSTFLFLEE